MIIIHLHVALDLHCQQDYWSPSSILYWSASSRYSSSTQISRSNRESYCRLHNYRLIDETDSFLQGKKHQQSLAYYSWVKIEVVCSVMKENLDLDWLFWVDTDALFMNLHISLIQLLAGVEDTDLIVIGADAEGINAGVFFIRNNPSGRTFCTELLNQRSRYSYEQQGMSALYNKAVKESGQQCHVTEPDNLRLPSGVKACLDKRAPGIRLVKLCAMGSWAGLERKRGHGLYFDGVYMNNDFIIHFPGDRRAKLGLMKKAMSGKI